MLHDKTVSALTSGWALQSWLDSQCARIRSRVVLQQSEEGLAIAITRAYTALGMEIFFSKTNSNTHEKQQGVTIAFTERLRAD
jgi:hypothetical protein